MRKSLKLFLLATLILTISILPTVGVKTIANSEDFDCVYGVANKDTESGYVYFGSKEVITYTEEEATLAGVPEGFSGDVISVIGNEASKGVSLDFSSLEIPIVLVKSITFRVYVGDDGIPTDAYPEVRIAKPHATGAWTLRSYISDRTNQWLDITLGDGSTEGDQGSLTDLTENGYLNKFEIGVRSKGAENVFYIDSIKLSLMEDDGIAPVITYDGANEISITKGIPLNLGASAFDLGENRKIDIVYEWENSPTLDEYGIPDEGTYNLTLTATDFFGNSSSKTIKVTVTAPDVTKPVIIVPTDNFYVKTGTVPTVIATVTDNDPNAVVEYNWRNALDENGRLKEGTHMVTVYATDSSGNRSAKYVHFHVSESGDPCDVIIDEEILYNEYHGNESESEEESETESESVLESESESESILESESESESILESESEIESDEESKPESDKGEESESVKPSESNGKDSTEESKPSTSKAGCGGSVEIASILSLLAFASLFVIRKKND